MLLHLSKIKDRLELSTIHTIFLEIEISKVFSANARWIPDVAYNKGRAYGYLRNNPEADALKEEIINKVSIYKVQEDIHKRTRCIKIEAELRLPHDKVLLKDGKSCRRVDLSNMWLVIENGLAEGLGLDDSLTTELYLEKTVSLDSLHYLILKVELYGVI